MKFSIVIPSYNQAKFVEAALQSVLAQDYKNKEILFIDGGSTDGTMEIVSKYQGQLDVCISEPDSGQSHALHKGFSLATGDVLTWLNTDDLLLPGALSDVEKVFSENPKRSWLLGNVIIIDEEDRILKCWRGDGYTPGFYKLGILSAGGPSAFFKRCLYESVGGINLNLHYQMDTELWWRFATAGVAFSRLPSYTWALRFHPDSKTSGHLFCTDMDEKQLAALEVQSKESEFIRGTTNLNRVSKYLVITKCISLARKILSVNYLRGLIENSMYRGRQLTDIYAKLRS